MLRTAKPQGIPKEALEEWMGTPGEVAFYPKYQALILSDLDVED